jgi:hypothetical protein
LLEVLCDMVYALLSRFEAMLAESTLARELSLGGHDARLLIVVALQTRMDVAEMLREMVLPEARLNFIDSLAGAETADPGFAWIALFLVPLPIALTSIPLAALSRALVDLLRVSAEKRRIVRRCATRFPLTSELGG